MSAKNYKHSRYNVVIPTSTTDKTVVWNTRTGAVLKLFPYVWNAICEEDFENESLQEYIEGLIKHGIIVQQDLDEYNAIIFSRRIAQYASSKKLSLIIAPTLACNFNCIYCFEDGKRKSGIMKEATMNKIIEYVESRLSNDKNILSFSLTWFGGEPLIGYESVMLPLGTQLIHLCEKYNVAHDAFIVTNGYFLTKAIVPDLLETLDVKHYQITLDGPEDEYCRKKRATTEEYRTVIDNVFGLSNYAEDRGIKCQIDIRINVDKSNYPLAKKLTGDLASDERFRSNIFFYLGKLQGTECDSCALEEFETIQTDYEYYTKSRLQEILPTKCVWCDQQTFNNFCIGPEGEMYKCERDFGDDTRVIGNIFTGLNYSDYMLKFFDPHIDEKCTTCKLYPVCLGGCPAVMLRQGYECIATLQRAIELVKREFGL